MGCFFAARISCLMNAPTAIKNAAATKNGGVKAARSDSTLLASLSKALRSPGDSRLWPAAREQETGITYQVRRHDQVGCRHPGDRDLRRGGHHIPDLRTAG